MTLEEMRAFVRVVELGSFTKAAAQLRSHTSRVSTLVSDLENRLNVQLLVRTTRSLRVTDAGREVFQRAAAILASVDELVAASRRANEGVEGELRITAAGDYGLLKGFAVAHPNVRVTLRLDTAIVDIAREDYDIALRLGPLADSSFKGQKLGDLRFGLFASPDYLARQGTPQTAEDLAEHDWLRLDNRPMKPLHCTWRGQDVAFADAPRFTFSDISTLRDAAAQGLGIAMLALPVAAPWLEVGRLSVVLPAAALATRPLYAVYSSTGQTRAVARAFVDHVIHAIGRAG
jgi:LysR family transcriptional regulator, regulator for bpeEF and oprC